MINIKVVKKEYEKLKKEIEETNKEISKLKDDENVKKYIDLNEKFNKLEDNFKTISQEYEICNMDECDHIYVKTGVDSFFDNHRTDKTEHYYCIKCGLDTLLASKKQHIDSYYKRIMKIYKKTMYKSIFISEYERHPALAKKLHAEIIKANPNITQENLYNLFKVGLHCIKSNDEEEHIKRLGLSINYDKVWHY